MIQNQPSDKTFFNSLIILSGIVILLLLIQRTGLKATWTFTGIGIDLWLCWLGLSLRCALKPSRIRDAIFAVVVAADLFFIFNKYHESPFPYWMSYPWILYPFVIGLIIPVVPNLEKSKKEIYGELLLAIFFVFVYAFGEFVGSRMWIAAYDKGGSDIALGAAPITGLFKVVILPLVLYFVLRFVLSRNILKIAETKWIKYTIIALSALQFLEATWIFIERGFFLFRDAFLFFRTTPFVAIIAYAIYSAVSSRRSHKSIKLRTDAQEDTHA